MPESKPSKTALELRQRLRRLGTTPRRDAPRTPQPPNGRSHQQSYQPTYEPSGIYEELSGGEHWQTDVGDCYVFLTHYPFDTLHGMFKLEQWLNLSPATLARIGDNDELAEVAAGDFALLDIETTGLGGAGTLAFLVGVGVFNADGFTLHQLFLEEPSQEPALLAAITSLLPHDAGLVTFNGRTFDVPILTDRFILNRKPSPLSFVPNLDLLHPARRAWRRTLPSCRLTSLEEHVLGVDRSDDDDVPGWAIPKLYQDYLQTGNAYEIQRIVYHNRLDMLSMITLGIRLAQLFDQPSEPTTGMHDSLSMARWYQRFDDMQHASDEAFKQAVASAKNDHDRAEALEHCAKFLKRNNRRDEAIVYWAQLAAIGQDTMGHVELAKYFEWHASDLETALQWTEAGIELMEGWRQSFVQKRKLSELNHRRQRLLRKLQR